MLRIYYHYSTCDFINLTIYKIFNVNEVWKRGLGSLYNRVACQDTKRRPLVTNVAASSTPARLVGNIVVAAVVIADTGSEREPTAAVVLVAYIVAASAVAELEDYKLYRLWDSPPAYS